MVDYNPFAKDFATSRRNMKWEEISYFFNFLNKNSLHRTHEKVLDVGCGSGRLLEQMENENFIFETYLGLDMSQGLIEEARKDFPDQEFIISDMVNGFNIEEKQSIIFFIASFHHLETYEQRQQVLEIYTQKLLSGGYICMTNWALESQRNREKYKDSLLEKSRNQYGSKDFAIKFGEHKRYYHSFSLSELKKLAETTGLSILENREFITGNNIINIFQKK